MSRIIIATIKRNYIVSKRVFPWSFIIARVLMGIYVSVFAFLLLNICLMEKQKVIF